MDTPIKISMYDLKTTLDWPSIQNSQVQLQFSCATIESFFSTGTLFRCSTHKTKHKNKLTFLKTCSFKKNAWEANGGGSWWTVLVESFWENWSEWGDIFKKYHMYGSFGTKLAFIYMYEHGWIFKRIFSTHINFAQETFWLCSTTHTKRGMGKMLEPSRPLSMWWEEIL